ncbi:hypothetical protein GGR53DRAFT_321727 [Hypoxylon sp. FL1150]|nr:hypothetical protein GGR53DRAFT_321727 [Hypoxylon sp. FL1150]
MEYLSDGSSPKIGFDRAMHDIIEESKSCLLPPETPHLNHHQQKLLVPKATRAWTMLIGEYSNRTLTFESDRLPAILALARRFSLADELPAARTYLAGLWLEDFPGSCAGVHLGGASRNAPTSTAGRHDRGSPSLPRDMVHADLRRAKQGGDPTRDYIPGRGRQPIRKG